MVPKRAVSLPYSPKHHGQKFSREQDQRWEVRHLEGNKGRRCCSAWRDWTARGDRYAADKWFEKDLHLPSRPAHVPWMLVLPGSWRAQNPRLDPGLTDSEAV